MRFPERCCVRRRSCQAGDAMPGTTARLRTRAPGSRSPAPVFVSTFERSIHQQREPHLPQTPSLFGHIPDTIERWCKSPPHHMTSSSTTSSRAGAASTSRGRRVRVRGRRHVAAAVRGQAQLARGLARLRDPEIVSPGLRDDRGRATKKKPRIRGAPFNARRASLRKPASPAGYFARRVRLGHCAPR